MLMTHSKESFRKEENNLYLQNKLFELNSNLVSKFLNLVNYKADVIDANMNNNSFDSKAFLYLEGLN